MARATASTGLPPEKVDVRTGAFEGQGHFGFSAALVPYFHAKRSAIAGGRAIQACCCGIAEGFERADPAWGTTRLLQHHAWSVWAWLGGKAIYLFRADGSVQLFWESACSVSVH